jgi:hypothetical protein
VASSATVADALASALCVLGEAEGRALALESGAEVRATKAGAGGAAPIGWETPGLAALRITD